MNIKDLGDFVFLSKYSRPTAQGHETWEQAVERVSRMHYEFTGQHLPRRVVQLWKKRVITGSQRSLQFGGDPILKDHPRIMNCVTSYADRIEFFGQAMWLLMCGCGVGFSVQNHHIARLPRLQEPVGLTKHVIPDTKEGWADAPLALISAYVHGSALPVFDYSAIRAKGALISSGGVHPGSEQLKDSLNKVQRILARAVEEHGGKWRSIDAFDIVMHLADAVISGGVRRSATICVFDADDEDMMTSKTGSWFVDNPQRGRANISAMLTPQTTRAEFDLLLKSTKEFGEPGFIFAKCREFLYNPCVEISMCPTLITDPRGEIVQEYTIDMLNNQEAYKEQGYTYESGWQACNLSTVNCGAIKTEADFLEATRAATILGTFQAAYNDWDYLGKTSSAILKRESLLGVSMTGIMSNPMFYDNPELLAQAAEITTIINADYAKKLGIPRASRITCVKPEGTASIVLGTSAGIHPYHAREYLRRVQGDMQEELFQRVPQHALEDNVWSKSDTGAVAVFACTAPPNAMVKSDLTALKHLEICKMVNVNWVRKGNALPTRLEGAEHNVSVTITVREDEWGDVGDYLWENREYFSGVSMLGQAGDYDYQQPPYQELYRDSDDEQHHAAVALFDQVKDLELDLSNVGVQFDPQAEPACQGGSCDLRYNMGDDFCPADEDEDDSID